MKRRLRALFQIAACVWGAAIPFTHAQQDGLVAHWAFDTNTGNRTHDSVTGVDDKIEGFADTVPGVSGSALRFDGYTTGVVREGKAAPKLKTAFTVEAWIELNVYPWNLAPILDEEADQQVGYFFGVDALGHITLQVSVDRVWQSITTETQLSLKKWVHVAGVFDHDRGLTIFIDGKEAAHLNAKGDMSPLDLAWYGHDDLLIGRVRQPTLPVPSERDNPKYAVMYSLDGALDDLRLYNRSLLGEEIQQQSGIEKAQRGEAFGWPVFPSGPAGAGRFGAYYTTLHYDEAWDRPRRLGPDSDIVVRFDGSPIRLVFWQGMNFIPAWVTENNKWYTDEFLEAWIPGCPDGGDCEPMSDKQSRYSHVRILESSDARTVIHWRYALSEVENYKGANPDGMGWFDWADEYWTVYPDGTAIRKQVLRSSDVTLPREWQESIVINNAGQRPEDSISLDAVTLENMQGQTATYSWKPRNSRDFAVPDGPQVFDKPSNPNIQLVNLKSVWKPFQVVFPTHASMEPYKSEKTFFTFECWNHWPVAQIVSSGRPCLAADRPSHSSLSHIFWDPYEVEERTMSKILLTGVTEKPIGSLLPVAKSWITPAGIEVTAGGFRSNGFDPAQRAFVLSRVGDAAKRPLELTLHASEEQPLVNPAFMVKRWGEAKPRLSFDGKQTAWGDDYRYGLIRGIDGTDLVVWIRTQTTRSMKLVITPRE